MPHLLKDKNLAVDLLRNIIQFLEGYFAESFKNQELQEAKRIKEIKVLVEEL